MRGLESLAAMIVLITSLTIAAISTVFLTKVYTLYKERTILQQIDTLHSTLESAFHKAMYSLTTIRTVITVAENTYIVVEKNSILIYFKSPSGKKYPPRTILLTYPVEGALPQEPGLYEVYITFRDDKFYVRYSPLT